MRKNLIGTVFSADKLFLHDRIMNLYGGRGPDNPVTTDELMGIYPIALEVGPSGSCNNRCEWCNHKGYQNAEGGISNNRGSMSLEMYTRLIDEVTSYEDPNMRTRGMIFSASGEPTLNKDFNRFMAYTASAGIDTALITNGTSFRNPGKGHELKMVNALYSTWTRISLNAGTPETRNAIHKAGLNDFDEVLYHLEELSKMRDDPKVISERFGRIGSRKRLHLGAQIVVEPENIEEIGEFVRRVKDAGIDYAQIKPVVFNPKDREEDGVTVKSQLPPEFWERVIQSGESAKAKFESENFEVYFKSDQFEGLIDPDQGRSSFDVCRAMFAPVIEENGDIFYCSQTRGDEEFKIGNLQENTFREIWEGERRRKVWEEIDIQRDCQIFCRNHATNDVLDDIDREGITKDKKRAIEDLKSKGGKASNFI